ncbi:MAG: hypothetical protein IPK19_40570 [Chloroflexi bacterium]|nr:hypothetical protein [Chloroflexota bacterium]
MLTDAGNERFLAVQQRLIELLRSIFGLIDPEARDFLMGNWPAIST